jgi:hypothetical protein
MLVEQDCVYVVMPLTPLLKSVQFKKKRLRSRVFRLRIKSQISDRLSV